MDKASKSAKKYMDEIVELNRRLGYPARVDRKRFDRAVEMAGVVFHRLEAADVNVKRNRSGRARGAD